MELCCSVCLCASSICDHHHLDLAGELVPAGDPAAPASVGTVVVCVARVSPGGVWGPGHSDREESRYVSYTVMLGPQCPDSWLILHPANGFAYGSCCTLPAQIVEMVDNNCNILIFPSQN